MCLLEVITKYNRLSQDYSFRETCRSLALTDPQDVYDVSKLVKDHHMHLTSEFDFNCTCAAASF